MTDPERLTTMDGFDRDMQAGTWSLFTPYIQAERARCAAIVRELLSKPAVRGAWIHTTEVIKTLKQIEEPT